MSLSRALIAYVATLVVFGILDAVWLGFVAKDMYRSGIGHLMLDAPDWAPAIAFYVIYIAGLVIFGVRPGLESGEWTQSLMYGALFGFFCYATYDLTNRATLKGWPMSIVFADLLYGTVASAIAVTAGFFITRAITR